ncbi:MAG TPA: hypothetical protein VFZ63_17645 [Jiangellaceae bacterium]
MRPTRCVVVALATALAMRALLWGTAGPFAAALAGTATFDELVALAAGAAAFAVLCWVGVVLVVTTLAVLPGAIGRSANRLAGRIAPSLAGRLVRVVLGLTLTAGPLSACTPALGSGEAQQHEVVAAGVVGDTGLSGVGRIGEVITPRAAVTLDEGLTPEPPTDDSTVGPMVGEPTTTPVPPPAAGLTETPTREHPDTDVVVLRGDTLWAIAARHLGADATAADIAAEWPRWYAANHAAIGDDPDLILPGTILRPPGDR